MPRVNEVLFYNHIEQIAKNTSRIAKVLESERDEQMITQSVLIKLEKMFRKNEEKFEEDIWIMERAHSLVNSYYEKLMKK